MIVGIGTDIVAVKRFESWQEFPEERLQRIFTQHELEYSRHFQGGYALERLAARFAAKEAFYKAFSSFIFRQELAIKTPALLVLAPLIEIKNNASGVPDLYVNWVCLCEKIGYEIPAVTVHLSLSHEKDYALAFVVLQLPLR